MYVYTYEKILPKIEAKTYQILMSKHCNLTLNV